MDTETQLRKQIAQLYLAPSVDPEAVVAKYPFLQKHYVATVVVFLVALVSQYTAACLSLPVFYVENRPWLCVALSVVSIIVVCQNT